jgi:hypothetical protein
MNNQNEIQKANELLVDFLSAHPEINSKLWIVTMWTTIAQSYFDNGDTYEQLRNDINAMLKHAKAAFKN